MQRHVFVFAILAANVALSAASAQAQTSADQVRGTLDELNAWLATSDGGSQWQSFLKTADLDAQLKKGGEADPQKVAEILKQFTSGAAGLNRAQFTAVRKSLETWLKDLELPSAKDLPEMVKAAAADLKPVDENRTAESRKKLDEALASLEKFIQRGGEEKETGWKNFLQWDKLQEQLSAEKPSLEVLTEIWSMYTRNADGLDYPQFTAARDALHQYVENLKYQQHEAAHISNLQGAFDAYVKDPSQTNAETLGTILGWLERTKQHPELVAAIRHVYARPNLHVTASAPLVVIGFNENIDQTAPVRDFVDGSSITGNSRTVGTVHGELVPNYTAGQVDIVMDARAKTKSRAYSSQGNVTVRSSGLTTIKATKPIYFTADGLSTSPAEASTKTRNTIESINAPSSQVYNIASQRVYGGKAGNEARASRQAKSRAESQLNQRVGKQIAEANQESQEDLLLPLARRGATPRVNKYITTADHLKNLMVMATIDQLAAAKPAPEFNAEGDVVARVHESYLNNLWAAVGSGAVMTDVDMVDMLKRMGREVPKELEITDETDPWSITYSTEQPISTKFNDGKLEITMRARRTTARDRVQDEPMHISAVYKVAKDGDAIKLVRDGEVKISFPKAGEKLGVSHLTRRKFWQSKFEALFEEEMADLGILPRGAWEKAGKLKLTSFESLGDGWIGLAWKMPSAEEKAAAEKAASQQAAK